MDKAKLVAALANSIPQNLADDLVTDFLQLRQDVATAILGRAAGGKLVETTVQILQHLETGTYEAQPNVDGYLRGIDNWAVAHMDDGLRICAARLARALYAIRNKRNVVHKGAIDPNNYDQRMLLHGAEWIIAELLRNTQGITMQQAGELIAMVHAPVNALVEQFAARRLVLLKLTIDNEILVLLNSHYPAVVPISQIYAGLNRRGKGSVANALRRLWAAKLIEGSAQDGYQLTQLGFNAALAVVQEIMGCTPYCAIELKRSTPRR